MNAENMEKMLSYKNRVFSKAKRFIRKHKRLSFIGKIYAIAAIICYHVAFYFYRNTKRFIALACIILFFVTNSSFSYPAIPLALSFAASEGNDIPDDNAGTTQVILSGEAVAESDAVLVNEKDVDSTVYIDADSSINPDVAEIDEYVSGSDILGDKRYDDLEQEETPKAAAGMVTTFDSSDWKLILVNKQHPIPDDYKFVLGEISSGMKCDERVIKPLYDMVKAAREDGINLIICSPYRDLDRQTMLFGNKIDRYMSGGMSYMDAYKLASQAVTVPGSSEHQIGLAVDIITNNYSTLDEGFGDTAAGKWLAQNSYQYGFILRYPAGKEHITSIEYEPWHFRYVGVDAATVITKNGICLEEFWNKYVN